MPANPNAGQRDGDAVSADREAVDLDALTARAEELLAVADRASPRPWVQSYERRCIDTGRLDDRGDVGDGYSFAPVPNEYDPAAEWELDAPAIAALHNDAPPP